MNLQDFLISFAVGSLFLSLMFITLTASSTNVYIKILQGSILYITLLFAVSTLYFTFNEVIQDTDTILRNSIVLQDLIVIVLIATVLFLGILAYHSENFNGKLILIMTSLTVITIGVVIYVSPVQRTSNTDTIVEDTPDWQKEVYLDRTTDEVIALRWGYPDYGDKTVYKKVYDSRQKVYFDEYIGHEGFQQVINIYNKEGVFSTFPIKQLNETECVYFEDDSEFRVILTDIGVDLLCINDGSVQHYSK